jgi:Co/Zn/Cd efflux system component
MSFGFHRAEVIGALTSVLMIWVVTAILVYAAVLRTIHLDFELNSSIMLISSGIGILVNIVWVKK